MSRLFFWQNRNLFTQLLLGFIAVLSFALVIAGVTLFQVQTLSASFEQLTRARNNADLIDEIHTTVTDRVAGTLDQLWSGRARVKVEKDNTRFTELFNILRASESAYLQGDRLTELEARSKSLFDLLNQILVLDASGKTVEARANWIKSSILFQDFDEILTQLNKANDDELALATAKANAARDSTLIIIAGCSVLALLSAFGLAFLLTRSIVKRVKKISNAMRQVSDENNLQEALLEVSGNDELSVMTRAFNAMISRLNSAIQGLQAAGSTVSSSSQYFSEAMHRQLATAEQEASAVNAIVISAGQLKQTAYDIDGRAETMAVQAKDNFNNLQLLSEAVLTATQQVYKTQEATQTVSSGISRMLSETEQVSQEVQELVSQLTSIQQLAGGLKDIASKTHLLALNAAIESAGAGPYGERFSVIASSVKNLAEQSQKLVGNMEGFIKGIEGKIENVTVAMRQTDQELARSQQLISVIEQVGQETTDLAGLMSACIQRINELLDVTVRQTQNIASATREQREATEEIIANINSVEVAVRNNMQQHQTSVGAVSELQTEVVRLNSLVGSISAAA